VATLGGPVKKDKVWISGSFEGVHENASINYSPDNLGEFNALSTLASAGLIQGFNLENQPVGVNSIAVPNSVKVPFRDYMGSLRLDWAQSERSQWFIRGSLDNYTTNNDFGTAGNVAFDGCNVRIEVHQHRLEQPDDVQPNVAGFVHVRCQLPASHRRAKSVSGIRARFSVQFHVLDDFGIRDFRR
jgi:hypothetical protein